MKKHTLILLFTFCCSVLSTFAYNLRQISSRDGLSNSSVTCLFQDNERFLWIGTYDGLNMYDSRNIYIYKPDINNQNSLSSNVIRNIIETEDNYLWISTKWGLNKLSQRNNMIEESYNEFGENSYIAKDSHNNLYVFGKPDVLSFYSKAQKRFIDIPLQKGMVHDNVNNLIIDRQDTIRINHKGKIEKYTVSLNNPESPRIARHSDFNHPVLIDYVFYSNKEMIFIDKKGDLYHTTSSGSRFIRNLSNLIQENGEIGSIIFDNQDILIGFKTNGLIHLQASKKYLPEKVEINCGVFSLWKDEQQDIIWIGTDGQGVYAWTKDEYTFSDVPLSQLPIKKRRPVRAMYADAQNTLWLGTKDNGIIRIQNYDTAKEYSPANVSHFTTQEGLSNNAVFAFTASKKHPILWIGSDGPGLNYYSYLDKKVHPLINHTKAGIAKVHSMVEMHDSLLWVGSGSTLLRISIQAKSAAMEAKSIRGINLGAQGSKQYNQIYSICTENDSIIWVGMRGNGVVRLNILTEAYRSFNFDKNGIAPMNDILCIHQDRKNNIWLGSSYGLIQLNLTPDGRFNYKNFNENDGLPNNTIHGITEDTRGNLWLSSNTGLILFNPQENTFRSLNHKTGLKLIEFSDNAYFQDNRQNRYFFGGVDGVVWIKNEDKNKKEFTPSIYFTKLRIFNKEYSISEFMKTKGEKESIVLNHDQNFFSVSFVAMDFINGENSKYSYKLENFSDVWMDTRSSEAQFTNIAPGRYILKVKYNDGISSSEKLMHSIQIIIRPPWYQTIAAQIFYLILLIGIIVAVFFYIRRKYERRKLSITRKLDEKYKEEMYEGKLRFFTNITHEFCTPLTLIYGPCERILQHPTSDTFIKKYAQIIKSNTERLNSLIQEVIDFRRMETGNKICHIQNLNISELSQEIIESFSELAEENNIFVQTNISPDIRWNSDSSCFSKIVNNLISNAFKYTPERGTIRLSVREVDSKLKITVHNTGKGISKESIPLIFNRYSVLDNIKENSVKGLSSRNGLGLAICQSMTELLQGTIEVESEINQYAQFTVTLPALETTEEEENKSQVPLQLLLKESKPEIKITESKNTVDKVQQPEATILVIDDNKELLWMLKDILSDEYIILTAEDGEQGLELLKQETPDLIITDVMMPRIDGITLTKQLKSNKHTMHIPLVILSAKNTTDEKIEGIESGADAYIPKPFNTQYLKTMIRHLIRKQKEMEQYYNTSASAFDFSGGQLLLKEDKEFLQVVAEMINENMDNTAFGPDELASAMQMSSRNFYRKFKSLEQLSPRDFIKDHRIGYAAKLLLTTTLTIQEVMYRTGFINRSHFYKEFAKRYNQTPKEYREENKRRDNSLA